MGDAFSDHGCESPLCRFCGNKYPPEFGCLGCRKDQTTGKPWDTAKSTRDAINRRIKTLRRWKKETDEKFRKDMKEWNREIRQLQAQRSRVTKDNPTGMVKIDAKELEKYVDEWEPGRSLWDPKRKEKK